MGSGSSWSNVGTAMRFFDISLKTPYWDCSSLLRLRYIRYGKRGPQTEGMFGATLWTIDSNPSPSACYDSNEHLDMWIRERFRAVFPADRNDNSNAKPMLKQSGAGGPSNVPAACGRGTPTPASAFEQRSRGTAKTRSQQTRTVAGEQRSPTSSAGGESTLTMSNSDSSTLQEGMVEGLVGSEDIELCWLQHGFCLVWSTAEAAQVGDAVKHQCHSGGRDCIT